jgi:DNA-binding MurR/RpiR family transcriptional regulator
VVEVCTGRSSHVVDCNIRSVTVAERILEAGDRLTVAERRVAEAVVRDLARVAFGTVAELAAQSSSSGPTVLRLASKLGFDGFAGLQEAVQEELSQQLRPAVERIRTQSVTSPLRRAAEVESANVTATLDGVDRASFERAARRLADRRHRVLVLAGEASHGVASAIAGELDLLRKGVALLGGSPVAVGRDLAHVAPGDVVLAIELRRYERWVLAAASEAVERGATLLAVTDSLLSPLAERATESFVAAASGTGPFDSHVGILALGNALVADVALRLRASATARLDAVEAAWRAADALTDG